MRAASSSRTSAGWDERSPTSLPETDLKSDSARFQASPRDVGRLIDEAMSESADAIYQYLSAALARSDERHLPARMETTLRALEELVARFPNHGRSWFEIAHLSRGLSMIRRDDNAFARALDAIDHAVRLMPRDRNARSIRGGMLEALHQSFDESHRTYAHLRALAERRHPSRASLLDALLDNHDRALKLESAGTREHATLLCRKARVLRALERYDEALAIYEGLRVVDPIDRAYYELAIAHTLESMGRDDAAAEAIERWTRAEGERRTSTVIPPPRVSPTIRMRARG
jgi:tetratricopeptide (TPR) repeat protein